MQGAGDDICNRTEGELWRKQQTQSGEATSASDALIACRCTLHACHCLSMARSGSQKRREVKLRQKERPVHT